MASQLPQKAALSDPPIYTKRKRATQPTLADIHAQNVTILAWLQSIHSRLNMTPPNTSPQNPQVEEMPVSKKPKRVYRKKKSTASPEDSVVETPTPSVDQAPTSSLDQVLDRALDMPSLRNGCCTTCGSFLVSEQVTLPNGLDLSFTKCLLCNTTVW